MLSSLRDSMGKRRNEGSEIYHICLRKWQKGLARQQNRVTSSMNKNNNSIRY